VPLPIFSRQEIERRWNEVRARLGQVDCIVVPSFYNSYYLSGVPVIQWGRWSITILFRARAPVLILPEFDGDSARENSPIDDVRYFRDDDGPSSMRTATAIAIEALKAADARTIAIEGHGMPTAMMRQLAEAFPGANLPDLTDAIDEVRIISSDEEIAYLRTASLVADAGMHAIIAAIRPGVPELSLCAIAHSAMAQAVPEGMELRTSCHLQQNERSFLAHSESTREPIKAGAMVEVVCSSQVWYYNACVERAILVGEPTPKIRAGYRAAVEAFRASKAAIQPGATFEQVHEAALRVFHGAGYDRVTTGSGLIRNILHYTYGRIEFGNFRKGNDRKLAKGMVVTIEPWALIPEVGAPRHCDMVLVTKDGQEVLSKVNPGAIQIA
jgi:Xaa-Pro aminopeptidase